MDKLYNSVATQCSTLVTRRYSTSFSLSIRVLAKKFHEPIYSLYGFVRLADEIVDTFHSQDKTALLGRFQEDTWEAIRTGVSLNPVLHAFQMVVNRFQIDHSLIEAFFTSMEMDIHQKEYDLEKYETYVFGSAEVVGLMCLKVFVEGDMAQYEKLKPSALRLGAAFQKVNFLRDLQADFVERGRSYFPGINITQLDQENFDRILEEIDGDFRAAYPGMMQLPKGARAGVHLAFTYYRQLFYKIKGTSVSKLIDSRVRIHDIRKLVILARTYMRYSIQAAFFSI
jgi:phytoene/squalene synthetase